MARLAVSLAALIASVALLVSGNAFLMTLVGLRLSVDGFTSGLIGWILVCYSFGFVGGTLSAHRVVERVGHVRAFAVFAAALACAAQLSIRWQSTPCCGPACARFPVLPWPDS